METIFIFKNEIDRSFASCNFPSPTKRELFITNKQPYAIYSTRNAEFIKAYSSVKQRGLETNTYEKLIRIKESTKEND